MPERAESQTQSILLSQLRWFISLRWIVATAVIIFSIADYALHLYRPLSKHISSENDLLMLAVGVAIVAYNVGIYFWVRQTRSGRRTALLQVSWTQILLDLACLTVLTCLTGRLSSPLLGFYVFHMIFASLLLSWQMAYAAAASAIAMLGVGLWRSGTEPLNAAALHTLVGWVLTLLLTVYLTNHITRSLRRHRRELIKRNRHIRRMSQRLRRQQNALISQEKMAALGQMAAGITHEIANPLASMDTLLQVMQRKPERATPETVQTLRGQVSRIMQIVRQMSTFAHPGEGQWQILALNDVVQSAMEMIRFDPRMQGVTLERKLSESAGSVRLMPQAMQQVIINLITNALDAMAEVPAPKLLISTERKKDWCVIQIADNGHGIAPGHLSRIFEPFFTTKPVGKGTGVGLSISYSLVQKQGGRIDVESKVGHGATFTIFLPIPA
jgi:C4-dicarboxylate-specific signal transduction histidine kinase